MEGEARLLDIDSEGYAHRHNLLNSKFTLSSPYSVNRQSRLKALDDEMLDVMSILHDKKPKTGGSLSPSKRSDHTDDSNEDAIEDTKAARQQLLRSLAE